MNIARATKDDCPELLALQQLAYQSEAKRYHNQQIAPLTQSLHDLQQEFNQHLYLKAVENDLIIGAVRGYRLDKNVYIGRLMVHPAYQGHGIGSALMTALEKEFKTANRFELFTGLRSKKNLSLYQKIGYRLYKAEKINDQLILVFLEKRKKKISLTVM